jgi:uncharacterized protein
MIGTRLDDVDAPRLIRSRLGWWFLGNQTWTLIAPEGVRSDGTLTDEVDAFLHDEGSYRAHMPVDFSLTVLTATGCNLGCGYCFQNAALDPTGGHRHPRIEKRVLRTGTIDRILHFTAERMSLAGLNTLYLLLFGGEPLLNPQGCVELLDRSRTIGLRSAIIATNGVLLKPRLAQDLEAAGLNTVQITFDGSRADHDRIRVHRSGEATFDRIISNIADAQAVTHLHWHLRVNVSHHNADRLPELFAQIAERVDPARCSLNFAWVGDAGFGYENALRHVDNVSKSFVDWSIAASELGFCLVPPGMKSTCQICSVPGGRYGAVVDADGTLYSCWQSAGKPGFKVGTVDDGYLDVAQIKERWVTCGYEYAHGARETVTDFQDRVDGATLDYLHTTGKLYRGLWRAK